MIPYADFEARRKYTKTCKIIVFDALNATHEDQLTYEELIVLNALYDDPELAEHRGEITIKKGRGLIVDVKL